jgi:hypothetical protein
VDAKFRHDSSIIRFGHGLAERLRATLAKDMFDE